VERRTDTADPPNLCLSLQGLQPVMYLARDHLRLRVLLSRAPFTHCSMLKSIFFLIFYFLHFLHACGPREMYMGEVERRTVTADPPNLFLLLQELQSNLLSCTCTKI
jgi:hypothetical protein